MIHNIKELENCSRELEITIEKSEAAERLDKAYAEAQPYVEHRGFRKGKVPIYLVKKIYGKQIERDTLGEIAQDQFNIVFKEQDLRFIGEPVLVGMDSTDTTYTFKFFFEVLPDFELKDYKALTIEEPIHNVTDDEIQNELDEMSLEYGTPEPAEQIVDDRAIVEVTFRKINEETGEIDTTKAEEKTEVYLHSPYLGPELRRLFMNLKTGDRFEYRANMDNPKGPNDLIQIEIRGIKQVKPMEVDDNFANLMTGGRLLTASDFREDIGFKLQEEWNAKSRQAMEEQVVFNMVNSHEFELPALLLESTKKKMAENYLKENKKNPAFANIKPEQFADAFTEIASRTLKWEIIKTKITEAEKIIAEDYDFEDWARIEAERTNGDYEKILQDCKENENVERFILDKKLMDLIIDFAITTEAEFDSHGHYHLPGEEHHHDHDGHDHSHYDHDDDDDDEEDDDEEGFSEFEEEKPEDTENK